MTRKKISKSKNIDKHFCNRCVERVGVCLNTNELVKKIQNNELEFLKKTSNTRTVFRYRCELDNKNYKIVYDKPRHKVVTIYPYDAERVFQWQKNAK